MRFEVPCTMEGYTILAEDIPLDPLPVRIYAVYQEIGNNLMFVGAVSSNELSANDFEPLKDLFTVENHTDFAFNTISSLIIEHYRGWVARVEYGIEGSMILKDGIPTYVVFR
jgi:hypothetical protein